MRIFTEEHKKKLSESAKKRKLTDECKQKISSSKKGKSSWNKGKKTGKPAWNRGRFISQNKDSPRTDDWSKKVKERDKYQCQKCGNKNNLHSHHIIPWKKDESKRFDLDNGITLCSSCHCSVEPRRHKGIIPPNKGIPCSDETKRKISESKKGKRNSIKTEFKKGCPSWNKNMKGFRLGEKRKPHSDETKRKISETLKLRSNERSI